MKQLNLTARWQLKERTAASLQDDFASQEGWLPATVPGTVHQDLMAAGRIPDPFFGRNERAVQWVGERDWLYLCTFDLPDDTTEDAPAALCCDGLDTFATVWLNGQQVLASDNMFLPHRVSLPPGLLRRTGNQVRIHFACALLRGKEREAAHGVLAVWNGDPSRVYVRKAQYHYGWDWGPVLLCAGPYRPVRLELGGARIAGLHCPAEVAPTLQTATLPVQVRVDPGGQPLLWVSLELRDPHGRLLDEAMLPVLHDEQDAILEHTFTLDAPQLWWPHGHGAQPRYGLTATLEQEGEERDRRELFLGLRRLRLVQEPLADEPGRSFFFEINNVPLFCGGANWIPADSFLPRVSGARYHELLRRARDAGMVMIRVWGGGIYEEDVFYDTCDELGLLVWQDFMFACGIYPTADWFVQSVRAEAEAALVRLRHHPSIVLWCGNNEDYALARSCGLYGHPEGEYAARVLYEEHLLQVCQALDQTRPYWPGSPYGGADPNDPTQGDRHTWDVWHGEMADYHHYHRFAGRFVSEFGMQAYPALRTLDSFTDPGERHLGSATLSDHNKAEGGQRRLSTYVDANVRTPGDLPGYVHASQLIQAEALGWAFRSFRRRFRGPGKYSVAGALVWQLNDCWPVISWSIIDSALRNKPSYHVIRRELAPFCVGLALADGKIAAWAVNGTAEQVEAELWLRTFTLSGEEQRSERHPAPLSPNQATELARFPAEQPFIHEARLLRKGRVVARTALWPEPFKLLVLPDPEIRITRMEDDRLLLQAARPAKGVWIEAEEGAKDAILWSDNMLDLMPGDDQIIFGPGLGERTLHLRWLGQEDR